MTGNAAAPAHAALHAPGGIADLSSYYVGRPVAPADGQLLAWSATLGAYTAVNASGSTELAAAKNITGTATSASSAGGVGAAVDIPATAISVANSGGRPVTIHLEANAIQTVAGTGVAFLQLTETTSGSDVALASAITSLPNSAAVPLAFLDTLIYQFPIGAVTTTRTFKLSLFLWSPAANSPTAQVLNSSNNPTIIRAVAG